MHLTLAVLSAWLLGVPVAVLGGLWLLSRRTDG